MRSITKTILCALPAVALLTGVLVTDFSSYARAAEEAKLTDGQKTEIKELVKQYLTENPEIVVESLKAYQQKAQADSMASAAVKIKEYLPQLTAKTQPSEGNPDAKVTVVEFFDYSCGYCKKAYPDIENVIKADKDVRVVFIEMPILGPSSMMAAQWSLAAHKQGKFIEFHEAVMKHQGQMDEKVLTDLSTKIGLDIDKLKKDAESDEIKNTITKNREMGMEIGIQGTPGFIVGDQLYPGYVGEDGLKQAISEARNGDKEG